MKLSGIPPLSTLLSRRLESPHEEENDENEEDGEEAEENPLSAPRGAGDRGRGRGGFLRCFIMDFGRHLSRRRTFPFLIMTP